MLLKRQKSHYQRLAFMVLRDAIGFYFGIPEFFDLNSDVNSAINTLITSGKTKEEAIKIIDKRIKDLKEDYKHCEEILSTNNIWYELLELDAEIFFNYINTLSSSEKQELAVIPKWTTQDYSLGRPYINDKFSTYERTNIFA